MRWKLRKGNKVIGDKKKINILSESDDGYNGINFLFFSVGYLVSSNRTEKAEQSFPLEGLKNTANMSQGAHDIYVVFVPSLLH